MASGSPIPWKTKHLVNLEFSGTLRVSRDTSDSFENKAFCDPGTPKGPARDLQGPPGDLIFTILRVDFGVHVDYFNDFSMFLMVSLKPHPNTRNGAERSARCAAFGAV